MPRTKVYTSEGAVIWVDRGGSIKTPPKSTDRRSSKRIPEQELNNVEDDPKENSQEWAVGEELLEEEIVGSEGEDGKRNQALQTVASAWPIFRDSGEDKTVDICYKLAKWAHEYRISNEAMDDLLQILKKYNIPDLPSSSAGLKAYLIQPEMEDDNMQGIDRTSPSDRMSTSGTSLANRKRKSEEDKTTVMVDVAHLNKLMLKMDVIDGKLDLLTANESAHSTMLKNVLTEIATVKASVCGGQSAVGTMSVCRQTASVESNVKISFPPKSQKELIQLEKFSHEPEGESALCQRFNQIWGNDLYDFFRKIVELLFKNTNYYSWRGRTANNAKHNEKSSSASELNIVRVLMDFAMQRFKETREACEQMLIKALQNYNAAVLMKQKRKSITPAKKQSDSEEDET